MGKFGEGLDRLESWFERQKRVLPWRDEPSLYRVWVSEIMLQQTQVVTVVPYFERFLARFPTVEALARAPLDDVVVAWAGLGYYSRARNLHRAAIQIVEQGFPQDRDGWLAVPGVGNYTAGAILSIALNQVEAILDGNVERVLSRVRAVRRDRGDAPYKERLWRLARVFVERAAARSIAPRVLNQALMELGATFCSPKKPQCGLCPLGDLCRARALDEVEAFPPRKKPKQWVAVREECDALFDAAGRVLVRLRAPGEWRAGLWDLPESPAQAGVTPTPREALGQVESRHVVTRHKITRLTRVWRVPADPGRALADPGTSWRWVDAREPGVAVGSALKKTLQLILERYAELRVPTDH